MSRPIDIKSAIKALYIRDAISASEFLGGDDLAVRAVVEKTVKCPRFWDSMCCTFAASELSHITAADVRLHSNAALRWAAENGIASVLNVLRIFFKLTAEDAREARALYWAARGGHITCLKELKSGYGLTADDARANNNVAVIAAASAGCVAALRFLRADFGLDAADARACSNLALQNAAARGFASVIQELRLGFGLTTADARESDNLAFRCAVKNAETDAAVELAIGFKLSPAIARCIHRAETLAALMKAEGVDADLKEACLARKIELIQRSLHRL